MFGSLFGSKKLKVAAPVLGRVMDITKVPDQVFSQKILGDGFAVEPAADAITAPCAGTIIQLADTRHALMLETPEGVQLLIHVGLDTVELKGMGFTACVREGDAVKQGDKLLIIDREKIVAAGKPLTTILVIANGDEVVKGLTKHLDSSAQALELELK